MYDHSARQFLEPRSIPKVACSNNGHVFFNEVVPQRSTEPVPVTMCDCARDRQIVRVLAGRVRARISGSHLVVEGAALPVRCWHVLSECPGHEGGQGHRLAEGNDEADRHALRGIRGGFLCLHTITWTVKEGGTNDTTF